MRIAIIQFPGSNCERETMLAVERAGMKAVPFLWNERPETLTDFLGFIIVGGFSYEDRSRAGVIAALDPIMYVLKQQSDLGKPVLGICNGAQILVEAGLVPGLENNQIGMALAENKRVYQGNVLGTGYYNAWVNLRLSAGYQLNAFTRCLNTKTVLKMPIAHGEGRFIIPPALLREMLDNGLNVFEYCDEQGTVRDEFPVNPNGSMANIAAVSNKNGNVMAIMPHPERTSAGDAIFKSMHDYIALGHFSQVSPMCYMPRYAPPLPYSLSTGFELILELSITDNQAISVENALRLSGISCKIKRYVHWEINCGSSELFEKIKETGLLYNPRKEGLIQPKALKNTGKTLFLVRAKENMVGQQKLQLLQHHFNIKGDFQIKYSVLWQIDTAFAQPIIQSTLLWNPYAHDYYYY